MTKPLHLYLPASRYTPCEDCEDDETEYDKKSSIPKYPEYQTSEYESDHIREVLEYLHRSCRSIGIDLSESHLLGIDMVVTLEEFALSEAHTTSIPEAIDQCTSEYHSESIIRPYPHRDERSS